MKKFFKSILNSSLFPTEKQKIYTWLSESSDIVELERRQRIIDRGDAPWQVAANYKLKGWS